MIIDNPHVMREIIAEFQPRFTHPGAEEIYTDLKDEMDAYAQRYAELADEIWRREYLQRERQEESKGRVISAADHRPVLIQR